MSTKSLGKYRTYRRHAWVNTMWLGLVVHDADASNLKTFNTRCLETYIRSANYSGSLVATCTPLPWGCSWDLSWVIGANGNVSLEVRAFDDDAQRSGVLHRAAWLEAYSDGFFAWLSKSGHDSLHLRKSLNAIVGVRAQLNFGFEIKTPPGRSKRR